MVGRLRRVRGALRGSNSFDADIEPDGVIAFTQRIVSSISPVVERLASGSG
jgi:hypothetical protein